MFGVTQILFQINELLLGLTFFSQDQRLVGFYF